MTVENPRAAILRSHAARDLKAPTLISFVDLARWIAALMVMVGHLRNPMFPGWGDLAPAQRTIGVKLWFFVTGYHAEAVLVFFVLSGYLVGGLSAARGREGTWDLGGYAIDRVARLFVAFVPALALGFALDWMGAHWFGATGMYDGTHPMIVEKIHGEAFGARLTLPILLGNLLMLQYYWAPILGSNDPLWTLSSEFWFYAVFGLALTAWVTHRGGVRWIAALGALAVMALLGGDFVAYFGLWVIGFAISQLPRPPLSHPLIASGALAAWLLFLRFEDAFFDAHGGWKRASQYVLAALFGWLILSMRERRAPWLERIAPFNRFMADFSYSVYLIHFPLIWFVLAFLGTTTRLPGFARAFAPTDPVGVGLYVAMILGALVASWAFAQATERRTPALRQWLKARLLAR